MRLADKECNRSSKVLRNECPDECPDAKAVPSHHWTNEHETGCKGKSIYAREPSKSQSALCHRLCHHREAIADEYDTGAAHHGSKLGEAQESRYGRSNYPDKSRC